MGDGFGTNRRISSKELDACWQRGAAPEVEDQSFPSPPHAAMVPPSKRKKTPPGTNPEWNQNQVPPGNPAVKPHPRFSGFWSRTFSRSHRTATAAWLGPWWIAFLTKSAAKTNRKPATDAVEPGSLRRKEGIFVGTSAGATFRAAAPREPSKGCA